MDIITKNARDLRKNATEAEKLLWSKLRNRQLSNLKFKRQYPVPPYILDFFCEEYGFAVEVDGGQHNDPANIQSDQNRTDFLTGQGVRVLRFWNNDVLGNINGVLESIAMNGPSPHPSPEGEGVHKQAL